MRDGGFLTVIIPTFNRVTQLRLQLQWLFAQQIDRSCSELIVVDDGSSDETWNFLCEAAHAEPWLRPLRQANSGQAAARQRGVDASHGDILLFLDDDMQPVAANFLETHRRFHEARLQATVALGAILPPPAGPRRPAFEHFYEKSIRQMYQRFTEGREQPAGIHFFSANVSLPKRLYAAVGGFDAAYRHAEDRELGLRLEMQAHAPFVFVREAAAYHHSPTGRFEAFLQRAHFYGQSDLRMAMLYPERVDLHPRSVLISPPAFKRWLAQLTWRCPALPGIVNGSLTSLAKATHRIGLTPLAVRICSVLFTINYVSGFHAASQLRTLSEKDSQHVA